jgi:hypothetical protein
VPGTSAAVLPESAGRALSRRSGFRAVSDGESGVRLARTGGWRARPLSNAQIEHARHMSKDGALVKLADKICNLRDMAASPPENWSLEQRIEYFDWAKAVVDGLPRVNSRLLKMFEQAYAKRPTGMN